jgi:hypothetical protein
MDMSDLQQIKFEQKAIENDNCFSNVHKKLYIRTKSWNYISEKKKKHFRRHNPDGSGWTPVGAPAGEL